MKFCHQCAGPLTLRIPPGDDKPRHCCSECDTVFYLNPKNVVGTLPFFEDKVLLCKRAIQPRAGKWTLPAGYMENGESSLDGAIRETIEEAGATVIVKSDSLYTLFNLPKINQVYMFFRTELANLDFAAGIESQEVALFSEAEIPWREIAFPVVKSTLEHYFDDLRKNQFPVRMFDVHHSEDRSFTTNLISSSFSE
ncbi:MAG: NUDIX hydrolase [Proteobacteria bacterium]|jgi:ADP-ribose pyrophosphatase YjhB (NUDIX family)|nr:NUDIX hydrolase [Pseudomonadota bacterium]MDA1291637.1 NUDIX hydrolase [Pseudomonadota bacterium]